MPLHDRVLEIKLSRVHRYNANINLFGITTIIAEFLPGGGILPYWRVDPVRLFPYLQPSGRLIAMCEVIFVAYIVFFIVKEASDLKKRGWKYWNDYWSWGEWSIICMAIVAIALRVYMFFLTAVSGHDRPYNSIQELIF